MDSHLWRQQADSVRGLLTTLANADNPIVPGGDPDTAATLVTDQDFEGRIIAVEGLEQNLTLAVVRSGYRGAASVAGGKRT